MNTPTPPLSSHLPFLPVGTENENPRLSSDSSVQSAGMGCGSFAAGSDFLCALSGFAAPAGFAATDPAGLAAVPAAPAAVTAAVVVAAVPPAPAAGFAS